MSTVTTRVIRRKEEEKKLALNVKMKSRIRIHKKHTEPQLSFKPESIETLFQLLCQFIGKYFLSAYKLSNNNVT